MHPHSTSRLCSVFDCNEPHESRGWCRLHYDRWRVHGDPMVARAYAPRGTPLKWIYEVALSWKKDECLNWPFGDDGDGYGVIRINGRLKKAHRVVCEKVHGPPPTPEYEVAHNCGKGHEGCCNPNHLRWATRAENNADKLAHGTLARGVRLPQATLSEDDVRDARRLVEKEGWTHQAVADLKGTSRTTISAIIRGESWAWLQ